MEIPITIAPLAGSIAAETAVRIDECDAPFALPKSVTEAEAIGRNYEAISMPFFANESHLLESLVRGLSGCRFLLVETPDGLEVWRPACDLKKCTNSTKSLVSVRATKGEA